MARILMAGCISLMFAGSALAVPDLDDYFYQGKLAEGQKALASHLQSHPDDDQAHFALGVIHFLRAFEKASNNLYEHGLRTDLPRRLRVAFPLPRELEQGIDPHPSPKLLTHAKIYGFIQEFLDDLEPARAELRKVKSADVKLVLAPARIQMRLRSTKFSALTVLRPQIPDEQVREIERFAIAFDRADAAWLCGYCHFLSCWGEAIQSLDGKDYFESHAHLFFSNVQTPHAFLKKLELDANRWGNWWSNSGLTADVISAVFTSLRMPVKEPQRLKTALGHLESMVAQSKQMWEWAQLETDDDREWIPNPKQTGVLRIKVTEDMVKTWREVLDEAEQVLQGKKLAPFWRDVDAGTGVNLRRAFTEPAAEWSLIRWIQGTAATPYLEQGPITRFNSPEMLRKINESFGGPQFFGFAFWFN